MLNLQGTMSSDEWDDIAVSLASEIKQQLIILVCYVICKINFKALWYINI
jgi:hypothetical protein